MDNFEFFDLDPDALDTEWVRQPRLFFDHAVKLADARREADECKAAVEVLYAELDQAVRADPEGHGLDKITEPAVKQVIATSEKYQAAQRELGEKKHAIDILQAAINALEHRKYALQDLVRLRLADYYSSPAVKEPGAAKAMNDTATVSNMKQVNSKITRKKTNV